MKQQKGVSKKIATALCASMLLVMGSYAGGYAGATSPVAVTQGSTAGTHSYVPYVAPMVHNSADAFDTQVHSTQWTPEAKTALNQLLREYGKSSPNYNPNNRPYAVFDCDNTTVILDVEEQLEIWQLEHLQFAMTPERFAEVIRTGLTPEMENLTYGADDGSGRKVTIGAVLDDVTKDYAILYKEGLITKEGRELTPEQQAMPVYQDFVAKMRWLYDAICEDVDTTISYPWVTYWYTGMTPNEVYHMAYACDSYYGNPDRGMKWKYRSWTSPSEQVLPTKAGSVSISFKNGITVSPEIRELYGAFAKNGIDTWICTASAVDVVRAAADYFKLPEVRGVVGMTNKLDKNGKYTNAYDYDLHPQTEKLGKAQSISKIIAPLYHGEGPIFTAMDSAGDFNFCTEFKNTKATLILNRIRKDDAGLCAAAAVYQKEHHISLDQANAMGDTKYLLQGRNENTGKLWPTEETLSLGKKEVGWLSPRALKALADLEKGMSLKEMFAKYTQEKNYPGYKNRS